MTRKRGSGLRRALAVTALLTTAATGAARPLEAVTFAGEKIRVDGLLREWPATLDALGTVVQGPGAQASAAIGYDATNLYVGATVRDARLARTASFGEREDHLAVELVFPLPEGTRSRVL
ncbi:MAG: hypothetical protein FJ104_11365, partial [Deltaproteobacteria bacterium]|nr:hypothetical protein [Deltaproteobacteria bacterium]